MTYKTLTTLFTFTGVITMCLARVEVLHERRWDLVGCLSPQRWQVLYVITNIRMYHPWSSLTDGGLYWICNPRCLTAIQHLAMVVQHEHRTLDQTWNVPLCHATSYRWTETVIAATASHPGPDMKCTAMSHYILQMNRDSNSGNTIAPWTRHEMYRYVTLHPTDEQRQ